MSDKVMGQSKKGFLGTGKKAKVILKKSKKLFKTVIADNQRSPVIPVQPGSCTTHETADVLDIRTTNQVVRIPICSNYRENNFRA
jgi:hypothetical protein